MEGLLSTGPSFIRHMASSIGLKQKFSLFATVQSEAEAPLCHGKHYLQDLMLTSLFGMKGEGCRVTDKWNCDGALCMQCAAKSPTLTVSVRDLQVFTVWKTALQGVRRNGRRYKGATQVASTFKQN